MDKVIEINDFKFVSELRKFGFFEKLNVLEENYDYLLKLEEMKNKDMKNKDMNISQYHRYYTVDKYYTQNKQTKRKINKINKKIKTQRVENYEMANSLSNFISNIYNCYKNKFGFTPSDKYLELQKKIDLCIDKENIFKIEKEFCNLLTNLKNGLVFWDLLKDIKQRINACSNNCIYAEKIILENGRQNCIYLLSHLDEIYYSLHWDSQIINKEYYISLNKEITEYLEKLQIKLNKINK
jgi:hypothetical protein